MSLPTGNNHAAVETRYDVDIQLNKIAEALKSTPIIGKAILIDEPMNAVIKAVSVVISNIIFVGGFIWWSDMSDNCTTWIEWLNNL